MSKHYLSNDQGRADLIGLISALDLDKKWTVEIKRRTNRRTTSQNSLLWKWHSVMAEETGHTADEIHEFVKRKFLLPRLIDIDGEHLEIYSTKTLTTIEMKQLVDQYHAWAATDLAIMLPHPDDQGR